MVKVSVVPVQPLAEGETLMIAVIAALPVLIAVNGIMLSAPEAVKPIAVLEFVQLYNVPDTGPLKRVVSVVAPLQ